MLDAVFARARALAELPPPPPGRSATGG